ncbi:transcription regulator protein BACH1b isoform X2 [Gadus morhua]|uniref:transcription regulator protein BACH1b isoform X2 n=1 Tax=Gadus morhua TaxID=8049 RepID=UPI0011B5DAB0|nr:transcription regulator protein BACH1-like isoform X2 [Gadus morhua]
MSSVLLNPRQTSPAAMSLADSPRSSVFTFESRTHCLNVLGRLDEQRHGDRLCDITVEVDGQSFRAHRAVLTACSEYFANVISKYARQGAVLTLPPEVTAAGFEPLLKFAYTSKLLFSKQDVLEVRSAASTLGFRDLDKTCFDFLLPKFFNSGGSSAPFPRKTCCKKKCKKLWSKEDDRLPSRKNETKPASDSSSDQEMGWQDNHPGIGQTGIKKSRTIPTSGTDKKSEETNAYFLQCPKYRKFQLACCMDRTLDLPAGANLPLSGHNSRGSEDQRESVVENPARTDAAHRVGSMEAAAEEKSHAGSQGVTKSQSNVELVDDDDVEAKRNPGDSEMGEPRVKALGWDAAVDARSSGTPAGLRDSSKDGADRSEASSTLGQTAPGFILHHPLPGRSPREDSPGVGHTGSAETIVAVVEADHKNRRAVLAVASQLKAEEESWMGRGKGRSLVGEAPDEGARERSRVEMEVAKPLPPPQTGHYPGPGSSSMDQLRVPVHPRVGSTCCPFLQGLAPDEGERQAAEGAVSCESPGMSPSHRPHPDVSPITSTEEADSETETECDDSFAQEKARQVQLPFSVDWVVNLSKIDFQQLLKKQTLNLEQQEFVHDMRRRSKNRMAAQRCRKRKLDCIHSLECEINKLRTERQRMLAEQSRLQQLKMKTWHTVSALCDKICSEASLMPEQLQVLAKYTTADCPFSSLIPRLDTALSGPTPSPQAQALLPACPSDLAADEAYPIINLQW